MWGNYWERRVCKLLNCPNLNQNSGCLLPELVSNLLYFYGKCNKISERKLH